MVCDSFVEACSQDFHGVFLLNIVMSMQKLYPDFYYI